MRSLWRDGTGMSAHDHDAPTLFNVKPGLCPACGQVPPIWTPGAIVEAARYFYAQNDRAPGKSDWDKAGTENPSSATVYRVFGGFPEMRRAAGLAPGVKHGSRIKWTRDRIVDAMHSWLATRGRLPKQLDWFHASDNHPCYTTVVNEFGSWKKGVAYASQHGPGMVLAEPIAEALESEIGAGRTFLALAIECGVNESYIGQIVNRKVRTIKAVNADKIICAIERPDVELIAA